MMNKELNNNLSSTRLINIDGTYIDEQVLECITDLYMYVSYIDVDEKKEKEFFEEFSKKYKKLNKKQQGIVNNEYYNITETQKEKVKMKGMI